MKITPEHFGKKMRFKWWDKSEWFTPHAFNLKMDLIIGENESGNSCDWKAEVDCWLPYEEPKPEPKLMAPTIFPEVQEYRAQMSDSLQSDKPLRVVIKNATATYRMKDGPTIKTAPYTFGKVVSQEDYCEITGDLWFVVEGE